MQPIVYSLLTSKKTMTQTNTCRKKQHTSEQLNNPNDRVAESGCRKEFTSCASSGGNLKYQKLQLYALPPFQHLLWEEIQPAWEVWRTEATVSPPASSSFTPAPSPRATASSASRLVSSCSPMIRISPPLRPSQDHQLALWLMNQGTQKRQASPRGREKCQKVSYPQLNTHIHFASAPEI